MSELPPILDDMFASGGHPRDMTSQQLDKVRQHLEDDLFTFAWVIFGFHDLNRSLHGQMCHLLQTWGQPGYRRLLMQIPRGHLKTSLGTIANSLWQVSRDPEAPVAIFNEKEENAAQWVRTIREVISNSKIYQTLWSHLLPPGVHYLEREKGITIPRTWKWTDTSLQLQRDRPRPEPSIQGLGIGSASAGRHWPKIIKDDLISEDAKNSPQIMERVKDWLDNSYALEEPALGGQDMIICTPWLYEDVYAYALGKYDYKLYRRQAIENNQCIFPEKFTLDTLEKERKRDFYHFSSQFMCQPLPGEEMAFNEDWLRYGKMLGNVFRIDSDHFDPSINPAEVPEPPAQDIPLYTMEKALLVDPAPSEDSERRRNANARNALVMEGIDYWGRRFVLDVWADRVAPPDVIQQMFKMLGDWGCNTIAIEEVTFSVLYRFWIQEIARRNNMFIRVVPLKPTNRTKDARVQNKIGPFRAGFYYLNESTTSNFVQEYLEYPYGGTRDVLDAMAYDDEPTVLPRPLSPEEAERYRSENLNWKSRYDGIDEVTGY